MSWEDVLKADEEDIMYSKEVKDKDKPRFVHPKMFNFLMGLESLEHDWQEFTYKFKMEADELADKMDNMLDEHGISNYPKQFIQEMRKEDFSTSYRDATETIQKIMTSVIEGYYEKAKETAE